MNKKVSLWFLQLLKIITGNLFPSQCLSVHSSLLVMPTTQTLTARRMVAEEPRAILMQITLSPFSVVSFSSVTCAFFVTFLVSWSFRAFLLFFSPVEHSDRLAHSFAACTISARHTRVCACILLPWTTDILSFRLSFLSCRNSTADHTRPTRRHVHDFRLPLIMVASFFPSFIVYLYSYVVA